jgi:CoA-transferase family III
MLLFMNPPCTGSAPCRRKFVPPGNGFRAGRLRSKDLTTVEGEDLLLRLAADADAVIENYSADVMPKLGLAYADLRKVNPDLVMVSDARLQRRLRLARHPRLSRRQIGAAAGRGGPSRSMVFPGFAR